MKRSHLFLSSALLLAAKAGATTVITTATGTAGADAHVQLGGTNADTNFGTNASLTVKYTGNDTSTVTRKAYFRFDLSSIGADVSSANLSLTVSGNNGGGGVPAPQNFTLAIYGLNDGSTAGGGFLGEDWGETDLTWNNAPANIVSGAGAGNAAQIGTGTADGGQTVLLGSFDVTSTDLTGDVVIAASGLNLIDFLNADTNGQATFIVTRTGWSGSSSQGSSNLSFYSKESTSTAPTLTLEVVPEPGSTLLLSLGGILLMTRRRR